MLHYILDTDGATPVPVDNFLEWAEWFERNDHRRVASTVIGWPYSYSYWVSTVFLGVDHSFLSDGPPILWETMVFRSDRYDRAKTVLTMRSFRLRPKFRKHIRRRRDHLGFDQRQDRYASLAEAVAGHLHIEAHLYAALVALRPTTVRPKLRTETLSAAASRAMAELHRLA